MTQSFTFREPVSHDLGPQPTMQHYNLMPNVDGIMLERPGQKRRREISDFGLMQAGNDPGTGLPAGSGTSFCDLVASQPSLAIEKQSFLDRMIHSARLGRFPLTGTGAVTPFEPMGHHMNVAADPAHVARFRSGRTLESTAAATAQAMANFQALIDEGRRSSNLFQGNLYENHPGQSNHGFGAPSFLSLSETGPQYGASSFRPMQNIGSEYDLGYGAPSFRSMQNTGSEYDHGYGAPRYNPSQTGGGFGGASHETNWPNLTCQTTSTRSLFASTTTPQSPRTPRSNNNSTVFSDAHQEYLNHMERINAMAAEPESPQRQRGRRLSYAESNVQVQAEKHVHIYLDDAEDPAPAEHVDVVPEDDWGTTEITVGFEAPELDAAPAPVVAPATTETEKFDLNEVPVGNLGEAATPKPRKKYHPRVAKDKRTYKRRVDGKKTPASPAAADGFAHANSPAKSKSGKRLSDYNAIQDEMSAGRDAASHTEVVDMDIEYNGSFSQHNTAVCDCEACIKLRLERRMQQQQQSSPKSPAEQRSSWHHDQSTESPPVRRTLFQPTPPAPQDQAPDARRSLACFDPPQQRSDPEAPAARRSLACFDPPQPRRCLEPEPQRSLACFDPPPAHTTAYSAVKSFFTTTSAASSCLQQFNESAALLGLAQRSLTSAAATSRVNNNSSFMSRLCPRGILSPQSVSFRDMNQVQRIVYLRAILSSSNQTMMSPESLLRHVHEHLPESEKQEFKESLWQIVLSNLTVDQEKQLRDYAQLEVGGTSTCTDIVAVAVKRGRGPNKVKKSPKPRKGKLSNGMEMVPYENKSLVPYEGPFDPLRKKKNRAKVVLDDETVRVWKMLMGKNVGSDKAESDAQKELKWEEERRKMQSQAMNFIERMHIVMGDRSFSKWKGSVVDSVVGAFLTQNVNDVLSSSAFMSMRSRFPGRGFRSSSYESSAPPAPEQDQSEPPPSSPLPYAISSEASSYTPPAQESVEEPACYEILAGAAEEGRGRELLCCPDSCTSVVTTTTSEALVVATEGADVGKFNPKTGLTGLERARIEEKQVSARKDFDFSALQDEFKPRAHGGPERLAAPARTPDTEDGVDWEAVRRANVAEVADVIKERGLNWILAGRIKAFLERIHLDYGTLDLEWLRAMSTDQTKDFLLSIRGLGLKSVECIRLLTLHHLAFPVDTNVGRICVRLGWVPLEPLPEELQLHLLELYPVQATIQKYLWPRLCKFDHMTLYELHYQMITFGKVFCTKTKPNCNACPMRPECKHFASALSSAKLALPASERASDAPILALPPGTSLPGEQENQSSRPVSQYCQPIIEEPMTPESEVDVEDLDIEDYPFSVQELIHEADQELIHEADQELTHHSDVLSPVIHVEAEPAVVPEDWGCLKSGNQVSGRSPNSVIEIVDSPDTSFETAPGSVLVANSASQEMVLVAPETASIPVPKLKNVGRLRTVHYVYELPDNHPLLDGLDPRESDDPCTYLLAIWSPGEVPESIPNMNDSANEESGPFASSDGEETIKATLLVPCRTAMRGSFPLNGTYFQVNEVFADHSSSLQPMLVPRTLLWNLRRRFVFFGTSVTSIFRGMTAAEIQACFWRGYVCVRGFDQATRAPKPLAGRLHLQAGRAKGANMDA